MKIYTKKGDQGKTQLFGGDEVLKNHKRVEAYGTVDELNALIGLIVSKSKISDLNELFVKIQNELFVIGSVLASNKSSDNKNIKLPKTSDADVIDLETEIDKYNLKLPELKSFILPGGTELSSYLHYARTVCRRAERRIVDIDNNIGVENNIIKYINRLSDLLFVLARYCNVSNNTPEIEWKIRG